MTAKNTVYEYMSLKITPYSTAFMGETTFALGIWPNATEL